MPTPHDLQMFDKIQKNLGDMARAVGNAGRSWYKLENDQDIPIKSGNPGGEIRPLSAHSAAVRGLKPTGRKMIYCRAEEKQTEVDPIGWAPNKVE
jgi:hypothetical protein